MCLFDFFRVFIGAKRIFMGVEDDIEASGKELVHKKKKKLEVRTEDVVVKAATYILKKLTNSN